MQIIMIVTVVTIKRMIMITSSDTNSGNNERRDDTSNTTDTSYTWGGPRLGGILGSEYTYTYYNVITVCALYMLAKHAM